MKRILFFLISLMCFAEYALAQPATYSIPVSIGRNNCGSGTDSTYFFNYAAGNLTRASYPNAYKARLKIGPASTTDRWTIFAASISFNPKDQKLYYLWTDYAHVIARGGPFPTPANTYTYIWRWKPDTTFTVGATTTINYTDTLRSFHYDIGGVAFDNNGIGWTLEFPPTNPCARAFFRPIDFAANIYNIADTLDFTSGAGGIGDTLWNPGSGDITMLPSGQIYYNFDNKLYTPDYGSYGGATHHIKSTYIDSTKLPAGTTSLVGLAFADGDLLSSYATGCIYRRLDPVTGDTNYVNYTYAANKGVYSVDMTQINSGVGASKKLVSVTATGTPNQYDVVYDVYVKNYGNIPITNIQVSDNLGLINGVGNVSNVTAAFTSNPAGLSLNPLYNGTGIITLLTGVQTLPNYPIVDDNFTIRISCRLSNILAGVVYNNQAITTANGFNSTALRDSSTNGNNPDLNQNDKPDDIGESQPTPFVIVLTPVTAPCNVIGNVLYNQDFGTGAGLKSSIPTVPNTASTTFIGTTTAPLPINRYTITNNAINGDGANWISLTDHTGNALGNMMVVNADAAANIFYRDTLPVACPGQQYSVSLWAAFIGNSTYQTTCNGLGGFKYPKFLIKIRDLTTGLVITQTTTADITSTSWTLYGMKFGLPAGYSNLILEIVNAGPGGCGNDVAIDDIQFGTCSAAPTVTAGVGSAGCMGTSTTFNSSLSDSTAISGTIVYQWQVATALAGPYSDIVGATSATYTIASLAASDTGKYYRLIVAASGNIGVAGCQYISPGVKLTGIAPSVAPASITAPSTTICNGASVLLTSNGATLGTGANYQWGTGAVVGTSPIGGATASTLSVSPTTTTTYWVRVENTTSPCSATTGGTTVTITVNQPSVAPSSVTGADICSGGSTTLTANGGALGTGANYQWGTGAVVGVSPIVGATSSTLTVSPGSTTTYWVQIQNTTAPCSATTSGLTKVITVNQPSTAPSSVTGADICAGGSTTLTAIGGVLGTGANYQWGTGAVVGVSPIVGATSATLTVSPGSTTTYWVQIQNTTAPCSATTSGLTKVITVNTGSTAPTSVTGANICAGSSTTLTALGGSLGTGANYQWGTGAVVGVSPIVGATSSTLTVSPGSTTTYWVQIQNTTAPCSATTGGLTKVITVSQLSVAATGATKNKNNICPGILVNLSTVGGTLGTAASWKWYTGSPGGTLIGSGTTISVTPLVTTTYYVRAEGSCNTTADQSVTVFISCDIDKDKDGIPDFVESNMAAAFADANSNGIINAYDPTYAGFVDNNNDYINDNFQADGDSDNDGIPNYLDTTFPGRVDSNGDGVDDRFDADKDGIINMLDLDSDNDGIPDVVEAYGVDTNGDGRIDGFTDTDGDGLSQNVDINNTGAYNTGLGLGNIDFDGDGVPNFIDLDSDNDGIPDVVESGGADTNNDGMIDGFVDVNGDGLHDGYINATGLLKTGADINGDGKADSYPNKNLDQDFRPNAYDLDSDGDGIVDVIEAGLPDANLDGRADGVIGTNGWSTTISAMPALNLRNTDGTGNPDYLDIDSDDDGIPDNIEAQPTATYKLPTVADTDGDGLANVYDNVPAAFGGSGIFVWDQDGDGIPDYRDLDTDGDGQPDIAEGNDFNLNGIADDNITLTGLDTDGDGLDNRFDSLNSTTNLKGTSYMMGINGSLVGDATPGARCPVQKKIPTQADRDWRFVGTVLPVQFLNFGGLLQNMQVALNWTIIATKDVDHFEIERSLDNAVYAKVGVVTDAVKLNQQQSFGYPDDINGVTADIIYYRLKVIGKNGDIKYSNILVIRRNQVKTPVTIMPNPANEYVSVKFFVEKESEITLRLLDNLGKTVFLQKQKVSKGSNMIQLNDLGKYSTGVYSIQLFINGEVITRKLIIGR